MIGIAALVVGIVLGVVFHPSVPEAIQPYLPIAVVAALDAVFGGLCAYLERIFDAFYTTKATGTGLGLSLCRTIIEEQGGSLWATPYVGRGAVFSLRLPCAGRRGR